MPGFRTGKPRTRLVLTAPRTLPAGLSILSWDAADYDEPVQWDGTTGIVLDRPGLWLVSVGIDKGVTGTAQSGLIRGRVNGVNALEARTGGFITRQLATSADVLELAAGDVLTAEVQVHTTLPGPLEVLGTHMTAVRIGPVRWT